MEDAEKHWIAVETMHLEAPRVVAQYVIDRHLFNHPDFKWVKEHFHWDKKGIRHLRTYSAVSQKDQKFKFGVQAPRSPKHVLELDGFNRDTGWKGSIQTELAQINAYQTFCTLEAHEPLPPGYERIQYHMVFDVKFDLQKKSRLVAGGNHTNNPHKDIHSRVVSLESLRTAFTLASLNGLKVMAADIGNAFLCG